jgi:hypothetical protein
MHIKIIAHPLETKEEGKEFCWTVNIFSDEKVLREDLSLHDPLKGEEKKDCQWYLEEYLGHEPYSTTRARKAAALLEGYGKSLMHQLQLSDLISESDQNLTVEIEDVSGSNSGHNSVHQLSWELLEDGGLWKVPTLSVCVRRLSGIPGKPVLSRERMVSWSHCRRSKQQINILLVIARDLERNSRATTDINPFIVSDLLAAVKSRLNSAKAPVDLNLEVVRPGTWKALKLHLERTHRLHGRGYFHIIHFDVHGKVKLIQKKNVGRLYFSDPKHATATKPVSASDVAREVGKYGIPIAILNACESARANAGEDANIANNFALAGVNNVLAMSYKASESAMKIFLDNFYMEFLVAGKSFTDSAMFARQMLRLQPTRQARFELSSPLCDWFVPVVYTSSPELSLVRIEAAQEIQVEEESFEKATEERAPTGREFDLLRLEKQLVPSETLYLFGPPGIGKTSFLHYVALSWRTTLFVDAVVFLDFSLCEIFSMYDFFNETLQQLLSFKSEKDLKRRPSISYETNIDSVLDILADMRVAFILDGLVDFRLTKGRDAEDQQNMKLLISYIMQFLRRAVSEPGELREENHIVIVSGRAEENFGDLIGHNRKSTYDLLGLPLVESVDLIHQITARPSQDQLDEFVDHLADIRKTEPLAHLLQGNPAALIQISRVARDSGISPREMYDILHSESPMHKLDPSLLSEHFELLKEFKRLIFTLPREGTASLLVLSWYWHEGSYISDFAEMLVTRKISSNDSVVRDALRQACRWGYIKIHKDKRISWIHSMFTIFCRIIACSSYSGFMFSTGDMLHDHHAKFAAEEMGLLVANANDFLPWPITPVQGLEYAVRLVHTVLSPHFTRDTNQNYWMFLISYLRSHNTGNERRDSLILSKGLRNPGLWDEYDLCKQNFIFNLKLCRGRGPLALPQVGWSALIGEGHFIRSTCNMEERAIIAKYYEELLNGAVTYSKTRGGRNAVITNDLRDIISLGSALADLYRRDIPNSENRHMEIVDSLNQIIEESEKAYGSSKDPKVAASKALLSIVNATALLQDSKTEESKLEMRKAMEGLQTTFNPSDPAMAARLEKFYKGKGPEEEKLWRGLVESLPSALEGFVDMWDIMAKNAKGESVTETLKSRSGGKNATENLGGFLSEFLQLTPELEQQFNNPAVRLSHLEEEIDRGHWLRAMGHHTSFVLSAVEKLNFDEALEHIQAQEDLAKQFEPEGKFPQKVEAAREVTGLMQNVFSTLTSKDHVDYDKVLKSHGEVIKMLQEKGQPNSSVMTTELLKMQEILQENTILDEDPTLPHNSAPNILSFGSKDPSQWIKAFFQEHLVKSSRSSEYQQNIVHNIANVLVVVRDLERAEDRSDEKEIFRILAHIEELTKEPIYCDSISKSKIQERRVWNTERLFANIWTEIRSLEEKEKFKEALILAGRCDTVVSRGNITPEMRAVLDKMGTVETYINVQYLIHLADLGSTTFEKKQYRKALRHFNDILKLIEDHPLEKFLSSNPGVLGKFRGFLKNLESDVVRTTLHLAIEERRWEDGVTYCQECRAKGEIWRKAVEGENGAGILEMEQFCADVLSLS